MSKVSVYPAVNEGFWAQFVQTFLPIMTTAERCHILRRWGTHDACWSITRCKTNQELVQLFLNYIQKYNSQNKAFIRHSHLTQTNLESLKCVIEVLATFPTLLTSCPSLPASSTNLKQLKLSCFRRKWRVSKRKKQEKAKPNCTRTNLCEGMQPKNSELTTEIGNTEGDDDRRYHTHDVKPGITLTGACGNSRSSQRRSDWSEQHTENKGCFGGKSVIETRSGNKNDGNRYVPFVSCNLKSKNNDHNEIPVMVPRPNHIPDHSRLFDYKKDGTFALLLISNEYSPSNSSRTLRSVGMSFNEIPAPTHLHNNRAIHTLQTIHFLTSLSPKLDIIPAPNHNPFSLVNRNEV
ncbi:hypothetical protein EG68_04454 [Paragonimus skrjabini miyazakii]|uniref:Uncharacterized protein n=1 Tax=Paragonimus skrjabini miyazakii TaxID=59628 RepID=A0A8S9ZA13_9TREM|nr:hypothetical protein EG68_04454 [Paragonimus skrjabini miyazakii]